jgi:hypothetical protein
MKSNYWKPYLLTSVDGDFSAKITAMACECEIVSFIGVAMLFGDNVLDMVNQIGVL